MTRTRVAATLLALVAGAGVATAQELEPRAYSPSPVGVTFVVVSATRSSGGVFTDPTLPITDAEATVGVLGLGIAHVFGLAGRQASVMGIVPVTWGDASGAIGEDRRTASRRGLADPRVKLSMILMGAPALRPAEFARASRHTILGVSLTVAPPVGQYNPATLINLGAHRWSLKPELGVSHPIGHWTFDAYVGAWFFTDNETFYPGAVLKHQDPISTVQGHVSYTLGRRSWIAVDATWYSGGQTSLDGVERADLQRNTRLGATWSLPLGRRQSVKLSYSAGATTRIGADFRTFGVAWQGVIF